MAQAAEKWLIHSSLLMLPGLGMEGSQSSLHFPPNPSSVPVRKSGKRERESGRSCCPLAPSRRREGKVRRGEREREKASSYIFLPPSSSSVWHSPRPAKLLPSFLPSSCFHFLFSSPLLSPLLSLMRLPFLFSFEQLLPHLSSSATVW